MTKGRFLFLIFLIELVFFISCMFVNINGINLFELWFSLAMLLIGIYSLVYSHLYKLDSCLYLGVLLLAFAFSTSYKYLTLYKFKDFYPIYIACFAFAHLAVFASYRQNIHFKLFAILAIEVILLLSYKINLIPLWALIVVNGTFLLAVAMGAILRARKNLRRISK